MSKLSALRKKIVFKFSKLFQLVFESLFITKNMFLTVVILLKKKTFHSFELILNLVSLYVI
jgi:hypothetical protein